jgi:hypothetical protein
MPEELNNHPTPPGYRIMTNAEVTPEMSAWAVEIFRDRSDFPMFSVATQVFGAAQVLARVEWHPPDFQNGAIHRGVTLYKFAASAAAVVRSIGVDSVSTVTDALIAEATHALGAPPAFWGRYFTSRQTIGAAEYRHKVEDGPLSSHGIRVLPIARQTNRVGGTAADGEADGKANAEDIVATFREDYLVSQGGSFFVFLDVEGSGNSHLSADYYAGWVRGLAQAGSAVAFRPCIYCGPLDQVTWTALQQAVAEGADCAGLWIARWVSTPEPVAWVAPRPTPDPGIRILAWQYSDPRNDGVPVDRDLVNPDIDMKQEFLAFLIPPPSPNAPPPSVLVPSILPPLNVS